MSSENNPFAPSQIEIADLATSLEVVEGLQPDRVLELQRQELGVYQVGWMSLALGLPSGILMAILLVDSYMLVHDPWLLRLTMPMLIGLCVLFACFCLGGFGLFALNRLALNGILVLYVLAMPVVPLLGLFALGMLWNRNAQLVCSPKYKSLRQSLPAIELSKKIKHWFYSACIVFLLVPLSMFMGLLLLMFYAYLLFNM